jgi:hypothetical protein
MSTCRELRCPENVKTIIKQNPYWGGGGGIVSPHAQLYVQ